MTLALEIWAGIIRCAVPHYSCCKWYLQIKRHRFIRKTAFLIRSAGRVFENFKPDVKVETTFVNKDGAATLKLGRAIALLVPAKAGLAVSEYAPNKVPLSVLDM